MVFKARLRYVLVTALILGFLFFFGTRSRLPIAANQYLPSRLQSPYGHATGSSTSAKSLESLWGIIHDCFLKHEPRALSEVTWKTEWPTMPQYQMNKEFDILELKDKSPKFPQAAKDKSRAIQKSLQESMPMWENHSRLYTGKGYVMTTGSNFLNRVFPIGIQMLHRLGSTLPIEIWTKNQAEYDVTIPMVEALGRDFGLNITCHRFSDYVDIHQFPEGYNSNYLMKAMTILLSSFEEVIMLDADNVPVISPEPLLESEEYKRAGLILWPDFWSNSLSSVLHDVLDIPYFFLRTCESGQIVLDKRKHFESLILAVYYNWFGDKFYKLITLDGMGTGDKDTFVLGAQTLGRQFHFVSRPVELLRAVHLDGRQWKEDTSVFNGAMGQFNPQNMSEIMFMHMHSPKLNFQEQDDVTTDLVFVRSDDPEVHFSPSRAYLEALLWESIAWVECASPVKVVNDPKKVCEGATKRLNALRL